MLLLIALTALVNLGGFLYVFLYLAPEASQGFVQKIFFFHVPSAFAMYAALVVAGILSILYLFQRKRDQDLLSQACMSVALLFGLIVMLSGPIWAKPIWGQYWTDDPRLTTTLIVFLLISATVLTRRIFSQNRMVERGAVIGSILTLIAVADIPLIHLSVRLWRGIHPSVLRNSEGLPRDYSLGLQIMILGFLLLCGCLVAMLYRLYTLEDLKGKRPHA